MGDFELVERDGLARLGRLPTPHGTIETPALLPVVHPDPERQPVPPAEFRRRLGLGAVITSSYITWRTPPLRSIAERDGIHALVRFDGPVMTDSGAFQQHAYGSVEVGPEEILAFQETIRSDIATVLDLFTEPDASHEEAQEALRVTLERARTARRARTGLLAVPVQGGPFSDLRAEAAAAASDLGDVLAVGGVVPLLERYRFADLARVLIAARPHLGEGSAVHLFGTGHPMTFAFAVLFGVDLIDSSAYHKFARRGSLMFPEGTVAIDDLREPICHCFLCGESPLTEVARMPAPERERRIAFHNLLTSAEEMARVRQAIRDGTLWELAERRATAHPALRAGLAEAYRHPEVFLATEPESRRAFRSVVRESVLRPAAVRFTRRLASYDAGVPSRELIPRVALTPEYLRRIPLAERSGAPVRWEVTSPFGPVPLELTETYPVGPYLGIEEFEEPARHRSPTDLARELDAREELDVDLAADWSSEWTRVQIASLLAWQYGHRVAELLAPTLRGERSRRTGRLRRFVADEGPCFVVGDDGIPRPTYRGGVRLRPLLEGGTGRVVVAEDAVPFVREGRSLFARFVVSADPGLVPDASALLVSPDDELLAIGRLVLAPHEMRRLHRGVAARVTSHATAREPTDEEPDRPGLE
jgi:7-cyano-7-deazaguanine tRNA-ribosyltransferase